MRISSALKKKQQPTGNFPAPRRGVCMNCTAGCGLKVFLNPKAERLFGDEDHPVNKGSLCPKVVNIRSCTRGGKRLSVPCVRASRSAAWKEASWEEALRMVADHLVNALEKDGPASIALPCFGTEAFDYFAAASWFGALLNVPAGPRAFIPKALGKSGALARMFGIPGAELSMNTPKDWSKSKTILILGGDPAVESPISFGPILDARDRGKTVLYLGASGGMTATRASLSLLVHPGTEALALAALVHGLLRDNLLDREALAACSSGLDALKEKLLPFAPEKVAPFCGVKLEELERFITILGHSFPLQVQPGSPAYKLCDEALLSLGAALPVLRGSVGIPGGGFNLRGVSPFRLPLDTPDWSGTFEQLLLSAQRPNVVLAYGDWVSRLKGGSAVREAVSCLDFIVHLGAFECATRELARVSLPLAHWSEYSCLVDRSDGRALQWNPQLFETFGQSLTPLKIWTALAGLMLPESTPPWDACTEESPQRKLAEWMLAENPLTSGIAVKTMDTDDSGLPSGGVLWPAVNNDSLGFEISRYIKGTVRGPQNILFTQNSRYPGHDRRFPTLDGLIHLESAMTPDFPITAKTQALRSASGVPLLALLIRETVGTTLDLPSLPGQAKTGQLPTAGLHPKTAAYLGISHGMKLSILNPKTQSRITASADVRWDTAPDVLVLEPDPGNFLIPEDGSPCVVEIGLTQE